MDIKNNKVLIREGIFCVSDWLLPIFTSIFLSVKHMLDYLLFLKKNPGFLLFLLVNDNDTPNQIDVA